MFSLHCKEIATDVTPALWGACAGALCEVRLGAVAEEVPRAPAQRRPAAHARGGGAGGTEPGAHGVHGCQRAAAAAPAGAGRRLLRRGHHVLQHGAVGVSAQSYR